MNEPDLVKELYGHIVKYDADTVICNFKLPPGNDPDYVELELHRDLFPINIRWGAYVKLEADENSKPVITLIQVEPVITKEYLEALEVLYKGGQK